MSRARTAGTPKLRALVDRYFPVNHGDEIERARDLLDMNEQPADLLDLLAETQSHAYDIGPVKGVLREILERAVEDYLESIDGLWERMEESRLEEAETARADRDAMLDAEIGEARD